MSAYTEKIKKFIGKAQYDEFGGQQIWGVDSKGGMQPLADVRGWGAIQNMFSDIKEAEKFQDELGKIIAEAINEKLEGSLRYHSREDVEKAHYAGQLCEEGNSSEGHTTTDESFSSEYYDETFPPESKKDLK